MWGLVGPMPPPQKLAGAALNVGPSVSCKECGAPSNRKLTHYGAWDGTKYVPTCTCGGCTLCTGCYWPWLQTQIW